MTKQELKNGMILELKNGFKYLYFDEILRGDEKYIYLLSYNDDLTIKNRDFPEFDVVKVYKNESISLKNIFRDEFLEPIWVKKTIELSPEEIRLLKSLDVIGFTHIVRAGGGNIFACFHKPIKGWAVWLFDKNVHPDKIQSIKLKRDLFSFVDWEDKEPTSIKKLLEQVKE